MIFPTMKLYRMPLTELIPEVRDAMKSIHDRASKMEQYWLKGGAKKASVGGAKPWSQKPRPTSRKDVK